MKVVGLITEYNPFHNGHLYHIKKAKELTAADYVIVVMSGNFVQRGAPAIYDKYTRTAMALDGGADLVLELPAAFSVSSAEDFAACSVSLLNKLGVVDYLCFGSEWGDLTLLQCIGDIFADEPPEFSLLLKEDLKLGLTFPNARKQALVSYLETKDKLEIDIQELNHILSSPNNILGIEYLKALKRQKSTIKPFTIKRLSADYHDTSLTHPICSATAIREAIKKNHFISEQIPGFVSSILKKSYPMESKSLFPLIHYRLLTLLNQPSTTLTEYADFSHELEGRVRSSFWDCTDWDTMVACLKTKQYTYTRINRALLHVLLEIKTFDIAEYKNFGYVSYGRVLGFRSQTSEIMRQIKANSQIPLITKVADAPKLLEESAMKQLNHDIFSAHIYNHLVLTHYHKVVKNEYSSGVVIL